jgi:hypothetical protein
MKKIIFILENHVSIVAFNFNETRLSHQAGRWICSIIQTLAFTLLIEN